MNCNFDLDLTCYVTFDFDAIESIIDAIGGVEIKVKAYEISHAGGQIQSAGLQTLNGTSTSLYAYLVCR